jgi:multimeric flavodoxin WrbA
MAGKQGSISILALSGSTRAGGNTDTLLGEAARGAASAGARVKTLYLRNYSLASCIGCEQCRGRGYCVRFDDGMSLIYPEIESSRGLILASPVYNYNITALMKAFIDRLYPYYIFSGDNPRQFSSRLIDQGRLGLVMAAGEQKTVRDMSLALPAMAMPLEALGYALSGRLIFRGLFGKHEAAESKTALKRAYDGGKLLAEQLAAE